MITGRDGRNRGEYISLVGCAPLTSGHLVVRPRGATVSALTCESDSREAGVRERGWR